jgi:serine/threonine-protein kinase
MIGRVLSGLYKIENRIGEGGMGTVYMAMHIHLEKPFAVKVLSKQVAGNREAIDRLKWEAKAASRLENDNIVQVVNLDTTDEGEVFIVMELLRGASLADLIKDGPLTLERAVPLVFQVCRALAAAHARDIVHRDLKPENVFIVRKDDGDFVKILDFGISKIRTAEAERVRMTRTGQLVGTPLYMSPEQARGETDIDKRADIYSLGVMFYEMLTGGPPFEGKNYFQLLWKHANEEAEPPSERAPKADIPHAIEQVILKALRKEPADRYQTMQELEAALLAAAPRLAYPSRLYSMTPASPVARVPARAMPKWLIAAGAVLLLAAGLAIAFSGDDPEPQTIADNRPVPPARERPAPEERVPIERPPPAPIDPPPGEEAPPSHVVRFESRPSGATVFLGDRRLGTTPFDEALPAGETPLEVRFSLTGHRDAFEQVRPADGARVHALLRRRPGGEGSTSSSPIKMEF